MFFRLDHFNQMRYAELPKGLEITEQPLSKVLAAARLDAEHFRPKFEALQLRLKSNPNNLLLGDVLSVCERGSQPVYSEKGLRVINSKHVRGGEVQLNSENRFANLQTGRDTIRKGDILMNGTGVGTIGRVAFFDHDSEAIGDNHVTTIRLGSDFGIHPRFLAIQLQSSIGQLQVEQHTRGSSGQVELYPDDIRRFRILRGSETFQNAIVELCKLIESYRAISIRLNREAEQVLLQTLEMERWAPSERLTYTRNASEVLSAGRIDSDYYAPPRYATLKTLASMPHGVLSDYCVPIRRLFDPNSPGEVTRVRNFDVGAAQKGLLDDGINPVPATALGSTKKFMQNGDVVISRLRSYLRQIAVVRTSDSVQTVGSTEFIVLRPRKGISSELLMVFLRSRPVQTILAYCQEGNQHPRFSESNLMDLPFPNALNENCNPIVAPIVESHAASQQARLLIAKAQQAVEIAVEEGESTAQQFLLEDLQWPI